MSTPRTNELYQQWTAGKLSVTELFEAIAKFEREIQRKDITISHLHEINDDLETNQLNDSPEDTQEE